MKRILLVILAAAAALMMTGCGAPAEEEIAAIAREDEALFADIAYGADPARALIDPEICHVYREVDCVVFTTGASGLLTDTRSGFYYSYNGQPCGAGYANKWKFTEEDGGWAWYDTRTPREYHTRHLFGNFYYFEGSW